MVVSSGLDEILRPRVAKILTPEYTLKFDLTQWAGKGRGGIRAMIHFAISVD
jgi:hypothetical protein